MSAIRKTFVLAGVLALALAGVALAATSKVTGGTATVTVSSAAANVLSTNHITAKALAPATASGNTFTFPISGGKLDTSTLRGRIVTRGGVSLSNGTTTVDVRRLTVFSTKHGVSIYALVSGKKSQRCHAAGGPRHRHVRCTTTRRWHSARVATVKNVSVSGSTATGTVDITAQTAKLINRLAGKKVVSAGDELGTATVSPTFA